MSAHVTSEPCVIKEWLSSSYPLMLSQTSTHCVITGSHRPISLLDSLRMSVALNDKVPVAHCESLISILLLSQLALLCLFTT